MSRNTSGVPVSTSRRPVPRSRSAGAAWGGQFRRPMRTEGDRVAALAIECRSGHPVAFGARWAPELAALSGDRGARDLLRGTGLRLIDTGTPDVLRDIDLPSDLPPPA